jgi:hypothetical protein
MSSPSFQFEVSTSCAFIATVANNAKANVKNFLIILRFKNVYKKEFDNFFIFCYLIGISLIENAIPEIRGKVTTYYSINLSYLIIKLSFLRKHEKHDAKRSYLLIIPLKFLYDFTCQKLSPFFVSLKGNFCSP